MFGESTVVSATLTEDGTLEIVRRYPSNATYACSPPRPVPDRIVKEVYRAGTEHPIIYLSQSIEGTHVPAERISERFEF